MGRQERIDVVICEPGRTARRDTIDNTLANLQRIAAQGGTITTLALLDDIDLICDDDGLANQAAYNRAIRDQDIQENGGRDIIATIVGTFILTRVDEHGEWTSLTDEQTNRMLERFRDPEAPAIIGGRVLSIPVHDLH